ncbi:MAG: redoxin domain-containing protein, partial [Gemmatimonadota bacterium]
TLDLALTLVAHEETRERGIREIRTLLDHVNERPDEERPLHETPEEARRESLSLQAALRVRLGEQLLDSGAPVRAILALDAADDLDLWLPDLYRVRLEALLSIGDERAARLDFHRLDADPVYPRESVDSLRRLFPSLTRAALLDGRRQAESEMKQRVLADDMSRGLPPARLRTPSGQLRTLESLLYGRPTVLLIWDRRVFHSPDVVADVIRASDLLEGRLGQVLWITPEPDSESLQSFVRESGLDLPLYHDQGSELAIQLGEWGMRGYFVIDGAGRIRARTHSLMEAVRHLEVLRLGSRDTA